MEERVQGMNKKILISFSILMVAGVVIFIGIIYYYNIATFTFGGCQPVASGVSFSPDGKKIIFGAINVISEQIFIMDTVCQGSLAQPGHKDNHQGLPG